MPNIGVPELLIVLVIVLVIFGASRLTDIMGALGKGVSEFRKGSELNKSDSPKEPAPMAAAPKVEAPSAAPVQAQDQRQLASNWMALGTARAKEGAIPDALKYLEQARQAYHALGDTRNEALACFTLAGVYDTALRDDDKAIQYLKESLALDPANAQYQSALDLKTKTAA
jgi:sec-independent protein translocase protein TatA